MKDSVKLGTAVVGGYLLGRTKKGKAAIGLALWLSGKRVGNSREALARLATSPELAKLTAQMRGPLLVAAQRAVTATIESRTTALADSLQQRTSQLLEVSGSRDEESGGASKAADARQRQADARHRHDEVDDVDDDETDQTDEPAEPERPRQAKRPAKSAQRSRAKRAPDETREPARDREPGRSPESGRGREPGRRRSTPRGGEAA